MQDCEPYIPTASGSEEHQNASHQEPAAQMRSAALCAICVTSTTTEHLHAHIIDHRLSRARARA